MPKYLLHEIEIQCPDIESYYALLECLRDSNKPAFNPETGYYDDCSHYVPTGCTASFPLRVKTCFYSWPDMPEFFNLAQWSQ